MLQLKRDTEWPKILKVSVNLLRNLDNLPMTSMCPNRVCFWFLNFLLLHDKSLLALD